MYIFGDFFNGKSFPNYQYRKNAFVILRSSFKRAPLHVSLFILYVWLLSCCKADRYKNDIFTFKSVTNARYMKRGSSYGLQFYFLQEIITCTIPSHIYFMHELMLMEWDTYTYDALQMFHCTCIIIRTKGNTIFYFCFQAHAYFEVDSKTTRLKSWKMKTTPHEIRATVYNEKIDVCFNSM